MTACSRERTMGERSIGLRIGGRRLQSGNGPAGGKADDQQQEENANVFHSSEGASSGCRSRTRSQSIAALVRDEKTRPMCSLGARNVVFRVIVPITVCW